jgi:hypothetical protein
MPPDAWARRNGMLAYSLALERCGYHVFPHNDMCYPRIPGAATHEVTLKYERGWDAFHQECAQLLVAWHICHGWQG